MIKKLIPYQQYIWVAIFLQALVAMFGSLYYSTFGDPVKNLMAGNLLRGEAFHPCDLCWWARILMYPMVFISYVGIAKGDKRFTTYLLPLSFLGILLDSYHYGIQKLPIPTLFSCSQANPCNALQVDYWGFITIPFLALVAFTVIFVFSVVNTLINREVDKAK